MTLFTHIADLHEQLAEAYRQLGEVRWITTGEYAREHGLHPETVRQQCAEGLIEGATQNGERGRWRIPVAA